MAEEKEQCLDVDYLFDHFDQFCHVQFRPLPQSSKPPCLVANLNKVFDTLTMNGTETSLTEIRGVAKPKSKPKGMVNLKKSCDKTQVKEKSRGGDGIYRQLRLNFEDIFSLPKEKATAKPKFRSCRNHSKSSKQVKNGLLNLIKAGVEASHQAIYFQPLGRRKSGGSPSKSRSRDKTKLATKKKVFAMGNLLNERDLFVRRIMGDKIRKSVHQTNKISYPNRSNRFYTTSNLDSTKRTHASIAETDTKSKSISYGKHKADSFLNPNNARTVFEMGKQSMINLGIKLTKDSHKKPLLKDELARDVTENGLGKACRNLLIKTSLGNNSNTQSKQTNPSVSKIKPLENKKGRSKEKDNYYIPCGLGYQGPKYAKHSSFALSEENSTGSAHRSHNLGSLMLPIIRKLKEEKEKELRHSKNRFSKTLSGANTLKK